MTARVRWPATAVLTVLSLLLPAAVAGQAPNGAWPEGAWSGMESTLAPPDLEFRLSDSLADRLNEGSETESRWLLGAGAGLVIGAGATYLFLHSGGSTSLCDRSANQDAMRARECAALTAAGGVVGAALGALVGSRFRRAR